MNKRREISLLGTIAICAVVILLRQLLKINEDRDLKKAETPDIPGL
jgi:hypothetical protein